MKGRRIIFLFFLLATACLDPYNPSTTSKNYGYLVVDSFVNSSDGTGTVLLTRTKPLNSKDTVPIVTGAQVSLEDENGVSFQFMETNPGTYQLFAATINASNQYKLKILYDGDDYQSDFVPVVKTPAIDSITWKQLDDKIEIYANTHDATNNSLYYRWKYDETWHYTSAFFSSVIYNYATHSVDFRALDDDIYDCYQSHSSSDIMVYSTTKFQSDVVNNFLLTSFPITSMRMQHLYSINVQQQVLTKAAYEYFEQLKKTTENVGSLFDPQPSQVTGNIHCTTDPSALAIGFFSLGTTDSIRIFIHPRDINFNGTSIDDPLYSGCRQDTLFLDDVPNYSSPDLLTTPAYKGIFLLGFLRSATSCVDCRLGGGTNVKPDFWP